MTPIRHLAWAFSEYNANPADYEYAADAEIVNVDKAYLEKDPNNGFSPSQLTNILALRPKTAKQFTLKQLKELVAARGFLQVVCNWLEPDQVEDEGIRNRVAMIQHLLSEIWEKLE